MTDYKLETETKTEKVKPFVFGVIYVGTNGELGVYSRGWMHQIGDKGRSWGNLHREYWREMGPDDVIRVKVEE